MLFFLKSLVLSLSLLWIPFYAHADLITKLTGITGLEFADSVWDVEFVDGTCQEVYGSCDNEKSMTPKGDHQGAYFAIFNAINGTIYDDSPSLISGCGDYIHCYILLPEPWYVGGVDEGGEVPMYALDNFVLDSQYDPNGYISLTDYSLPLEQFLTLDTSELESLVWARWTEVTQVYEPPSLAMLGLGLAGLLFYRRGEYR